MKKYSINIGRELGSGGRIVGKRLSEMLNIHFYDKELINIVSKESGMEPKFFEKADENRRTSFLGNLFGLRSNCIDTGNPYNYLCNDTLFKLQSDVIRELANENSAVFVGRCADYILRTRERSINIFITSPMDERIDRVCEYMELNPTSEKGRATARAEIEHTDRNRARYYNYYSNKKWGMSATYHLSIDSTRLGLEGTAEFIKDFANKTLF